MNWSQNSSRIVGVLNPPPMYEPYPLGRPHSEDHGTQIRCSARLATRRWRTQRTAAATSWVLSPRVITPRERATIRLCDPHDRFERAATVAPTMA